MKQTIAVVVFCMVALIANAQEDWDAVLIAAVIADDWQRFDQAILQGADPNAMPGRRSDEWVMCAATLPEREEFLLRLIELGGSPSRVNPDPEISQSVASPLVCAMTHSNRAAFSILMKLGADVDLVLCDKCPDKFQRNALDISLSYGQYDLSLILLDVAIVRVQDIQAMVYRMENRPINESHPLNESRLKIAQYLRDRGHVFTLWTLENEKKSWGSLKQ